MKTGTQPGATVLASPMLTTRDVCALAGGEMHFDTVRRAIDRGELRAYRVGVRGVRILRTDAEAWLLGRPLIPGTVSTEDTDD